MICLDRNYFFEFSGMPKSGKSTTIEAVRHLLRRLGVSTVVFHGHDRNTGIDKSNSGALNIVLASKAVSFLYTSSVNESRPSIHLLDRGIFDRSVFVQLAYLQDKISYQERTVLMDYLLLPRNCRLIDTLFTFSVKPEESLIREYANTLLPLPGRIMNLNSLTEFHAVLSDQYARNSNQFNQRFWIDTSNQAQRETALFVATQIWQSIGRDVDEFPTV